MAAIASVAAVLLLDRTLHDRSLLTERPPEGSFAAVFRSALLLGAAFFGLRATKAIVGRWIPAGPSERDEVSVWATAVGLALAISGTVVLLSAPSSIGNVAAEDGPIEWLSAGFAFSAAALIGAEAFRRQRSGSGRSRLAVIVLVLLALLIALIGLEEVSWFQRVARIESPDAFRDRGQPELNLHNAATDLFETLYYLGGFAFTVLLPVLFSGRRLPPAARWLEDILPTRLVMYGAAVAAAMTYEMWEIIPIQLAFFVTLLAMVSDPSPPGDRRLAMVIVVSMISIQAAYLLWGDGMARSWDDTELRELIIPFGFLLYAIGLGHHQRRLPAVNGAGVMRSTATDA